MCGRYYIASEDADRQIRALIDEINRREARRPDGKTMKTGEVFPSDDALVVANSRAGNPRPFLMRWGFETGGRSLLINARSETADSRPLFAPLTRERRLVVPATGYFEWERRGSARVKYLLTLNQSPAYMAGLYRLTENGGEFVILTKDADPKIRFIHERMPVLFAWDAAMEWLSAECDFRRMVEGASGDVGFCECAG